ncbi:hypothetical protein D3P09_03070 [Paenibacillus pinisoli]|uniref:DUF4083 domain-containing protein n=1 Tax=Paenibacillus pinisoli TaxID=1276110 RepID=A0A3A6PW08_9BACL|nr:hypothetical protein [Paenibacillus pinisoli]RJX41011.1 hypothetical protein D3P09_03070 [Paenibacillus pinisoli]
MAGIIFVIILFVLFFLILSLVVRGAIDNSKMSQKMDLLISEIRELRKEGQEDKKHIIDKRV